MSSNNTSPNINLMLANLLHIGASTSIPSTASNPNTAATMSQHVDVRHIPADQLTVHGTRAILQICCRRRGFSELPVELTEAIYYINNPHPSRQHQAATSSTSTTPPEPAGPRGDPFKPPSEDIFSKKVPNEIRRQILATWLPAKDVIVKPLCGTAPPKPKDPKRKGKRNKTSDMMTVCKKIKDEMAICCYEERTFAIHVHEGLTTGGVEAFDAGRQPLQYHANSVVDDRFARFGDKDEFGFKKLKKIEITFFPTNEDARFTTINTYYMSKALAGLLERNAGQDNENRIVSITFKFAKGESAKGGSDRRSIIARENRWWDPDNDQPRSTALGHMSDIELVLRPFAIFDNVHSVSVHLPPGADTHPATTQFVSTLISRMTGAMFAGGYSTDLHIHNQAEAYMEGKRAQLEAEIFERKWGNKADNIPNIDEKDDFTAGDSMDVDDPKPPPTSTPRRSSIGTGLLFFDDDDDDDDDDNDKDGDDLIDLRMTRLVQAAGSPRLSLRRSMLSAFGRRLGSLPGSTTRRTTASGNVPRLQTSGSMPSGPAMDDLDTLAAERRARRQQTLYSRNPSAGQDSDDDSIMAGTTSATSEGAILHQPWPCLFDPPHRRAAMTASGSSAARPASMPRVDSGRVEQGEERTAEVANTTGGMFEPPSEEDEPTASGALGS